MVVDVVLIGVAVVVAATEEVEMARVVPEVVVGAEV